MSKLFPYKYHPLPVFSSSHIILHINPSHQDEPFQSTFSCSKCPNVYGTNDKLMSHIQMCHADILVGPLFSEGKSH